jgi:hypothetical protein
MTAQIGSVLPRHDESEAVVAASPDVVFALLDDHARFSSHMGQSSWQMGGGSMETVLDEGQGKRVGSHIRMSGKVLGMVLSLDEVVTERQPPTRKVWETVGSPRLRVIGPYRMGFSIAPTPGGSRVRVFIDYALPGSWFGQLLGRLLARFYAHWCTKTMVDDAVKHFAAADAPATA